MNPGDRLGPYEVKALLGRGGMGTVYRAVDTRLRRDVALKVIDRAGMVDAEAQARIEREARAVAGLNHPNIVVVYDVGISGSTCFIAMEYIDGPSLRTLLRTGAIDDRRAIGILAQIASGLADAHAARIVHRDLKPENVMLNMRAAAKIVDFGLARVTSEASDGDTRTQLRTAANVIRGTWSYLAPEQLRGEMAVVQSDQFAFGVLACELLAGVHPFSRSTPLHTALAILEEPVRFRDLKIRPPIRRIIGRCLAKRPEERYAATVDLARDLEELRSPHTKRSSARRAASGARHASMAVLPFENASGDPELEHIADGLTDQVIGALSKLPLVRVMARATVFHYRNRRFSPQRVGFELGVGTIIVGRLERTGAALRVKVQVLNVSTGGQIFAGEYVHAADDVLQLHERVAEELLAAFRPSVTTDVRPRVARRPTRNNEAYAAYLRGRHFWNSRSAAGLHRAVGAFQSAIELDPQFALPYVGLADVYIVVGVSEVDPRPPREAMTRARAAAEKAIALDPELAEARVALGAVRFWFDWEWDAAQEQFERAIRLNRGYAPAHYWFAELLLATRRFPAALDQANQAWSVDPLAETPTFVIERVLYMSRLYDRAIEHIRRVLQFDDRIARCYSVLASCYLKVNEPALAEAAAIRYHELSPGQPFAQALLAHVYGIVGKRERADAMFAELVAQRPTRYVCPYYCAVVQAGLGQIDAAFASLEQAFIERPSWMAYLNVAPILDPLRSDPRFADAVRRMQFPATES